MKLHSFDAINFFLVLNILFQSMLHSCPQIPSSLSFPIFTISYIYSIRLLLHFKTETPSHFADVRPLLLWEDFPAPTPAPTIASCYTLSTPAFLFVNNFCLFLYMTMIWIILPLPQSHRSLCSQRTCLFCYHQNTQDLILPQNTEDLMLRVGRWLSKKKKVFKIDESWNSLHWYTLIFSVDMKNQFVLLVKFLFTFELINLFPRIPFVHGLWDEVLWKKPAPQSWWWICKEQERETCHPPPTETGLQCRGHLARKSTGGRNVMTASWEISPSWK